MATHFFWDPVEDNIVQERDDTGVVTAEYATEPYLYGNLISQNRGGVESQYHFDPQGSTLALTNDNQQVTDTYAYSAFGEVTEHTGNTVNPFQYGGQYGYYKDELTGDIDIRRRPAQDGRWLSIDPLGVAVVANGYIYVDNSPTNSTDPSGLLRVVPKAQLLGRQGCGKEPFITWDFLLDTVSQPKKKGSKKGAPCEGYIVQHVVVSCAVVRCVRGQCL